MIAHTLLFAAGRLWRVPLRPLGRGAVNDGGAFFPGVMLRRLVVFVRLVPRIMPVLVPLLAVMPVLRRRTSLRLLMLMRMTVLLLVARLLARGSGALAAS